MAVTRQAWKWRNHKSDNSQVISFTRWAASPSPPFSFLFFSSQRVAAPIQLKALLIQMGDGSAHRGSWEAPWNRLGLNNVEGKAFFFSAVFQHFRLFSCSATSWNYCDFWRSLWILSSTPFPSCGPIYVIGSSFHSVTKTQCCHTVFFTLLWKNCFAGLKP